MDENSSQNIVVTCATNIQWTNGQGMTSKKLVFKAAQLRVLRNNFREMFVEITALGGKSAPLKLRLQRFAVHKKFVAEGKASIHFQDENCTVFMTNAPTGSLCAFLRLLIVKTSAAGTPVKPDFKKRLEAGTQFDEISPVTTLEMAKVKQRLQPTSKATTTTPSPPQAQKRPRVMDPMATPEAKKRVFKPSRLIEEPQQLNAEQKDVLQACLSGKNIFFTGSAGTGKSYLLRRIIAELPPDSTMATASTGVAACLIGGMTLHSFAGIGSGEATLTRCFQMAEKPACAQVWRKCKHLIIDEVSMVDCEYFAKVEAVARHVRRNEKPFGGIQLILCGDFLQLPPVVTRSQDNNGNNTNKDKNRFCFQSAVWEQCIQLTFELKTVHRQKDPEFVRILNLLRIGRVTDEVAARLLATAKQRIERDGILATQLCSHTKEANLINQNKLERLETEAMTFEAQDSDKFYAAQLDQQVPAPGRLELRVGAQVMLLKNVNLSQGLVNGARGVVLKFENNLPRIRFKSGDYLCRPEKWSIKTLSGTVITRSQVPLKLAWAFSIHKSQGLTLDCVEMSLSRVFEAGQAYVALSRAQSLDSLRVLDFDAGQVWANPEVLRFYRDFRRSLNHIEYYKLGQRKPTTKDKAVPNNKSIPRKVLSSKPLVTIC